MAAIPLSNTAHVTEFEADEVIPETSDAGTYKSSGRQATRKAMHEGTGAPIPERADVLIIGGGPGGSTAATLLTRAGLSVVVIERQLMPRHHVGESYITSFNYTLQLLGLEDTINLRDEVPLQSKRGAYITLPEGYRVFTRFAWIDAIPMAYQCQRDLTDRKLLQHAASVGAKTFEHVQVEHVDMERKVATWSRVGALSDDMVARGVAQKGTVSFTYVLDCSGSTGVLHRMIKPPIQQGWFKSMDNIAVVSYWSNVKYLAPDSLSCDKIVIDLGKVEVGGATITSWVWGIPVNCGDLSVGVVMNRTDYQTMKKCGMSFRQMSDAVLDNSPYMRKDVLGKDAVCNENIIAVPDRSHFCDRVAGTDGWFLVGDSAAFIDPFLSTGLHLATYAAVLASCVISSLHRKEITAEEAVTFYTRMYGRQFNLLQWVISSILNRLGMRNCDNIKTVMQDMRLEDADRCWEVVMPALGVKSFKNLPEAEFERVVKFTYQIWEYFTCKDVAGQPETQIAGPQMVPSGRHPALAIIVGVWIAAGFGGFTRFFGDTMALRHMDGLVLDAEHSRVRRMSKLELVVVEGMKTATKIGLPLLAVIVSLLGNFVNLEGFWLRTPKLERTKRFVVGSIALAVVMLFIVLFV